MKHTSEKAEMSKCVENILKTLSVILTFVIVIPGTFSQEGIVSFPNLTHTFFQGNDSTLYVAYINQLDHLAEDLTPFNETFLISREKKIRVTEPGFGFSYTEEDNRITFIEDFIWNSSLWFFGCTLSTSNMCVLLDTASNTSYNVGLPPEFKKMYNANKSEEIHNISMAFYSDTLFSNADGGSGSQEKLVFVTRNVKDNTHHSKQNAFTFFRMNLQKKTLDYLIGSDKNMSMYKVSPTINFHVVYSFQYKSHIYSLVKYNSYVTKAQHFSIIQTTLKSEYAMSIEIRVRCEGYISLQSGFLLETKDGTGPFLYTVQASNTSSVVSRLSMPEVAAHFVYAKRNCRMGSYTNWQKAPEDTQKSICEFISSSQGKLLFMTARTIWTQIVSSVVSDIGLSLTVQRQNTSIVAYMASESNIYKLQLDSSPQQLTSWSSEIELSRLEYMHGRLYGVGRNNITYMTVNSCEANNDEGSCKRDVISCIWCWTKEGLKCSDNKDDCSNIPGQYIGVPPRISNIDPLYGPSSGNIPITVIGTNLDMAEIIVDIGKQRCQIYTVTQSSIKCRLPPQPENSPGELNMTVRLDGSFKINTTFNYRPSPTFTEIRHANTTVSGGVKITFNGTHLDSLPNHVYLYLRAENKTSMASKCEIAGESMTCITPPIATTDSTVVNITLSPDTPELFAPLHKLNLGMLDTRLTVLEDPVLYGIYENGRLTNYKEFPETDMEKTLTFKGKNFLNIDKSEIRVDVFDVGTCIVTIVNDIEFTCTAPESKYASAFDHYHLTIMFGENLVYYPGNIKYKIRRQTSAGILFPPKTPVATEVFTTPQETTVNLTSEIGVTEKQQEGGDTIMVVLVVCGTLVAMAIILVVGCRKLISKSRKRQSSLDKDRPSVMSYHVGRGVTFGDAALTFPMISRENSVDGSIADVLEETSRDIIKRLDECKMIIKGEYIKMAGIIGKGNFGSVYKGFVTIGEKTSTVAIKTLHHNDPRSMDDSQFLKEAYVMKDFQHDNVMTLIGICLDLDAMPLVILPYMEHGDLLSYLHDEKHIPTVRDLVSFGLDIVKGMAYLATLKFVHRDLAARNCMLDVNFHVKVADFGLSRDIYETSYYSTKSKGTKLPVKWMAVESLSDGKFNEKTDVWSYGVTLWELMTRGVRPYAAVDSWDMERYLKSGRRLPQPIYCPSNLYKVMRKCWSMNPEDRPTFADLQQWIADMLNRVHHQLGDTDRSSNISTTYVNLSMRGRYKYENEENFS